MKRRNFVKAVTGGVFTPLVVDGAASLRLDHRVNAADIVFRRATVFDGSGKTRFEADVAVVGDRIKAVVDRFVGTGKQELDLSGMALAPGFVDIHAHTDINLLVNPQAESKVRQGVTTDVTGQDGSSMGPWTPARLEQVSSRTEADFGFGLSFNSLDGFFRLIEREPGSINLASMVGTGTVRAAVVGLHDRPATPEELDRMRQAVSDALSAGACGLSSGLEYIPDAFSSTGELVYMAEALRGTGLCYAAHIRNEDRRLLAAVEEVIRVGQMADVPVQIAHLKAQGRPNWWKADPVLDTIDSAAEAGVDVMFDRYPYVAYSTGLDSLFPTWMREGGSSAFLSRIADPELKARAEIEVRRKVADLGSWNSVQVTSTSSEQLAWARGRRMGELAEERGDEPFELLLHLIREDNNRVDMVGFGMDESNTEKLLAHSRAIVGSDGGVKAPYGPLSEGSPHPRNYGSFPRILGHYCRTRGVLSLEDAVAKMSGTPARRLRFADRGFIRAGMAADLVVFDPSAVEDTATFLEPHQYPRGIPHVVVNGAFVIRDGSHTGERPGQVIRPQQLEGANLD
jgi:N-acyl-D-amino-acid deacylase